jgi:hypothetical protein
MGTGTPWLLAAYGLGVVAVVLLRIAWSLPRRSPGWNGVAWAALAGAVICGWQGGGAWGVSVVSLVIMGAAFVALAAAGTEAPRRRPKPSNRGVGMLPLPGEPRRIGRRVITFLIVIPGGLIASIALGFLARDLGAALGWREANANVTALYTVPVAWSVQARRRDQLVTLLICALACTPFLLTGIAS